MSKQMSAWVSLQVLRETRFLEEYKKFEKEKKWQAIDFIPSNRWNIGVLGIGAIGKSVALSLSNFGYNVKGWSRSCLLYTSPSPRDATLSRMPSSA